MPIGIITDDFVGAIVTTDNVNKTLREPTVKNKF